MRPIKTLVDKSALEISKRNATARDVMAGLVERDEFATCAISALEFLDFARGAREYGRTRKDRGEFIGLGTTPGVTAAALDIQRRPAERGRYRVSIADLLIAATALEHGAPVLRYDKHYDLISEIAGQDAYWIAPRGSGH